MQPVVSTESYGCVYSITNLVNGKQYVGQTIQPLSARWAQHCYEKRKSAIKSAIKKYGRDKFVMEVLAYATSKDELNDLERQFISQLNTRETGYNITDGGTTSWNVGLKCPKSEEHKNNIRKSLLGKPKTAEHAKKSRDGIVRVCGSPVRATDLTNGATKEFVCIKDAGRELGFSDRMIYRSLKLNRPTHNYRFERIK